jgi:hypothetical protein
VTRFSCPSCRLRFATAAAATLTSCPECGQALQAVGSAEATLGYRLFDAIDPPPALPIANEAALPVHHPRPDPS